MARKPPPDRWEVEDAANTLKRAHGIRKDRRMMRHVRKHVKRQAADMNALSRAMQSGGGMDAMAGGQPQAPQSMDQAFGS